MFQYIKRKLTKTPFDTQPHSLLDFPLLYLDGLSDPITVGNVCEGVHIFGGTGSGKTSGSGKALALSFLNSGMGGLVLTAKPDELETWQGYIEQTGRNNDLVIFSPSHPHTFNFLHYECTRQQTGGGQTENIVDLLMSVSEATERGKKGTNSDPFFDRAAKQLARNAVDLCRLASGEVTLSDMMLVINNAPQSLIEVDNPETGRRQVSFGLGEIGKRIIAIQQKVDDGELSDVDINDFNQTVVYWCNVFPLMADKTRSSIISTLSGMADIFMRGQLARLFSTETTITPEDTFDDKNKIIVIDMSVKQWGKVGIAAQIVFKLLWQQAIERRRVEAHTLPSFLWADEAQFFVTEHDQQFLTTARQLRACMVYLSQNLPNYTAALGEHSKSHVDSLMGNFQTKIFHQNSDTITNMWAADVIGKNLQMRHNFSQNTGYNSGNSGDGEKNSSSNGQNSSSGAGSSEQIDYEILPIEFSRLRKGGFSNECMVDAIVHQGGRRWNQTGKSYLFTSFNQQS